MWHGPSEVSRDESESLPLKMVAPTLLPGVKECSLGARFWIDRRLPGPLPERTRDASNGEVLANRRPIGRSGNDVIDVKNGFLTSL